MSEVAAMVPDVDALSTSLAETGYVADLGLSTALFCAVRLGQPLLLEGEPGVGKTAAALAMARVLDTPLVRLQCYEGIDAAEAIYEWNYPRQLLAIRLAESSGASVREADLFTAEYLAERPLLRAIRHPGPRPVVLLIDEVDRADDEFEAFLFETLAEASVTIPELGTVHAVHRPVVILTSNRTRDLHDALKRRCLYHWIDYPRRDQVARIVRRHVSGRDAPMVDAVSGAIERLRSLGLQKPPGIAEAIDWIAALELLGYQTLDGAAVGRTLGSVLKYREDREVAESKGLAWVAGGS